MNVEIEIISTKYMKGLKKCKKIALSMSKYLFKDM